MPEKQMATNSANSVKSHMEFRVPPLEELIAEIESETGQFGGESIPKVLDFVDQVEHGRFGQIQYIRFSVSDKLFAVPLEYALEIGDRPAITPIPNIPEWILGISNIRGEIVSMIDLCRFLSIGVPSRSNATRYIVVHNRYMKIGILVDRILGMLALAQPETEIQESPYVDGEFAFYTKGVIPHEKKPINIIDIEKILTSPKMTEFQSK